MEFVSCFPKFALRSWNSCILTRQIESYKSKDFPTPLGPGRRHSLIIAFDGHCAHVKQKGIPASFWPAQYATSLFNQDPAGQPVSMIAEFQTVKDANP